jgi:hypothetical protein
MNDLEQLIRDALTSTVPEPPHEVQTDRVIAAARTRRQFLLRRSASPRGTRPGRRSRWAVAGPVLAAACVAVLAAAIALISVSNDGTTRPPVAKPNPSGPVTSGDSAAALIGTSWTLATVRQDGQEALTIPANLGAVVSFEADGILRGKDGVHGFGAKYRLSGKDELVIADGSVTLNRYDGDDPLTWAAVHGMLAVLLGVDPRGTEPAPTPQTVTFRKDARALQLSGSGYTLTFTASPASASPVPLPGPGGNACAPQCATVTASAVPASPAPLPGPGGNACAPQCATVTASPARP